MKKKTRKPANIKGSGSLARYLSTEIVTVGKEEYPVAVRLFDGLNYSFIDDSQVKNLHKFLDKYIKWRENK